MVVVVVLADVVHIRGTRPRCRAIVRVGMDVVISGAERMAEG